MTQQVGGSPAGSKGLARHKLPERLEIVDDLPRTDAGKVRKVELRRRIGAS